MRNESSNRTGLKIFVALAILGIAIVGVLLIAPLIQDWWANIHAEDEKPVEEQAKEALQSLIDSAILADEKPNEILSQTESRNGFEILEFDETDAGGVATVRIYAPDLYTAAKELDENDEFATEEEIKNALVEAIGKAELVEKKITIEFRATDEGYEPILTMEFIDAYYGGVLKLLNDTLLEKDEEAAQ